MTKAKRELIEKELEAFADAAMDWGWMKDQGCGDDVEKSEAAYKEAMRDLRVAIGLDKPEAA